MIVDRLWRNYCKGKEYRGVFLFGFIPLYIRIVKYG